MKDIPDVCSYVNEGSKLYGPFCHLKISCLQIIILSSMLDDVSKLPVDQDNTAWRHKRHTKPENVRNSLNCLTPRSQSRYMTPRARRYLARIVARAIKLISARRDSLSWVCQILNFENRTIIKGDMAENVNQVTSWILDAFWLGRIAYNRLALW